MAQAESTRIGNSVSGNRLSRSKSRTQKNRSVTPRQKIGTVRMVQLALKELTASSRQGITLQAIKKHICDKYEITINAQRRNLIANYLRDLLEDGKMVNVTGKGLVGHLRYVGGLRRLNPPSRKKAGKNSKKPAVPARAPTPYNPPLAPEESVSSFSEPDVGEQDVLQAPRRPRRITRNSTTQLSEMPGETPRSSQSRKRWAAESTSDLDDSDEEPQLAEAASKKRPRPKRRLY